ncbi:MAG: prepilin peptidase [Patescibacteria group bacterium]|nr:prepilin peptidase [Patescibacteria group bacterium]
MNTMYLILFFLFGLIAGSFLNVVIFRMDDLKSILSSRSHCPSCKKILKWYDLIPFISFVLLRAKCRYCGKNISWQYPLVELGTAVVYAVLFFAFGLSLATFFYSVIFSLLIVVFVYDLKTQMTPEPFVWAALILSTLGGWYFGNFGFLNMIYGGLIGGGILAFLVLISKEKWMGSGDIKIGLILGFLTGYPVAVLAVFLSFLMGSIAGLIYMKAAHKTIKDALPFAPFLISATFISILFGNLVINWYLGTLVF